MNHDETNSNPDQDPAIHSWIEPELEARIVAWVAGEASAFEIAELERLVAEKPELAMFKRRIEAVHELMTEAARPDKQPMRLSAERRAKVLAAIGNAAPPEANQLSIFPSPRSASRWLGRTARMYYALGGLAAACVVILVQFSQQEKSDERSVAMQRGRAEQAQRELRQNAQSIDAASARAEFNAAPVTVELPPARPMKAKIEEDSERAASAAPTNQAGAGAPAESSRIRVGLLAQSRVEPGKKSPDDLTLGGCTTDVFRPADGRVGRDRRRCAHETGEWTFDLWSR